MKILNLYAGIGGNRKLWNKIVDADIFAVEWDEAKAKIYQDYFPKDEVIIGDAHEYLLNNFTDFDFIWSSPPCPSHSLVRKMARNKDGSRQNDPIYPSMNLYQEILLLQGYFEGKWLVENVKSWYDPLIKPQERQRHYFWANFTLPLIELDSDNIKEGTIKDWEERFGYDLSGYDLLHNKKRKILRNCVHPLLGKEILQASINSQEQVYEQEPLFVK